MKCEIAKRKLLGDATRHYLKSRELFTFESLYSENEPYTVDELIQLMRERVSEIAKQCEERPLSEFLKTALFCAETQLNKLEKRHYGNNCAHVGGR